MFGTPLIFVTEVWWRGTFTAPPRLLLALALTYAALIALNLQIGFRRRMPISIGHILTDSARALALGLLTGAAALAIFARVSPELSWQANLGRIILQSIPFSLGVGLANGLFGHADEAEPEPERPPANNPPTAESMWRGTLLDAGATGLGAMALAFGSGPSDEVRVVAYALTPAGLLVVVAASLIISYLIVFEAEFRGQKARRERPGVFQSPIGETVFSYLLSLIFAAAVLWFFQSVGGATPWDVWLRFTIVLGFPATIGGAAGRVAI